VTHLYRITDDAELAALPRADDGDGFVHLSYEHQVLIAANTYYRGRADLLLATVDPDRLDGEIRIENGFPHLYGALPPEAIVETVPFPCDDDGGFT
jgi:uncharacterized protein (DUF952 family)